MCFQDYLPIPNRQVFGGPTDTGLLRFAETVLGNVMGVRDRNKKVFEVPFNSTNKYKVVHLFPVPFSSSHQSLPLQLSVHISENRDESYLVIYLIGAYEDVVNMCSTVFLDGQTTPLTDEVREEYVAAGMARAANGERIVGTHPHRVPTRLLL